jgi:hypothetical protein
VGFLPAHDPRVRGTIEAVERELVEGGFVLRYRTADTGDVDGLTGREGAFLACSFWLADCLSLLGRDRDARQLLDRLLGLRNDLGLLSEEYDPVVGRLVGNFPQAFSHVSLVNSASKIAGHEKPTANHVMLGLARRSLTRSTRTGGTLQSGGFSARDAIHAVVQNVDPNTPGSAARALKAVVSGPAGGARDARATAASKAPARRARTAIQHAPATAPADKKTTTDRRDPKGATRAKAARTARGAGTAAKRAKGAKAVASRTATAKRSSKRAGDAETIRSADSTRGNGTTAETAPGATKKNARAKAMGARATGARKSPTQRS